MSPGNARQQLWQIRRRMISSVFVQNVASTFAVQVLSLAINIASAAIIARKLGPEGKGAVALALLVTGMLGLFLSGGIGVANVYFVGSRRAGVPALVSNSLGFAILTTLLGSGIVGVLIITGWLERLVPGVSISILMLAMVGFPLNLITGYFNSILQGLQRIITLNILSIVQGTLMLVFTLLLVIVFQLGVTGALLAYLVSGTMNVALLGVMLRREGGVFKPQWDRPFMRSTLSFALRGHIGNVLQFFNYRLDVFLINYFLNPAEVGIYTVSARLAEMLWNLPNAVSFVIFPKAAATRAETMNVFTPRVFRITLGFTTLGALGLMVLGRPLILLVYSSMFAGAYVPMLALLPGVVLLGGAKVLTNEIAGRGYPHYNSVMSGLALILTIVFDLLLIPRHGVLGASLASSISYIAIFFISIGFYKTVSRKTTGVSPSSGVNETVLSG